jgi:hypothetical protein
MEDNRLPKRLLNYNSDNYGNYNNDDNYHPKGRRRPGRPLKRLLDDMTAETETGHPGLNSLSNMMMMMMMMTIQAVLKENCAT